MRNDRSSSIAFLLSVGAIPLGCPSGEEDNTGQTSFVTSVGNGASTDPSGTESVSETSDGEGTDTNGPMTMTGTTDPSASTDPSTTAMTMSTTEPSTDPSLTDPSTVTDPDTGYGTYGTGGFQCTGAVMPPACQGYANKVVECYPKYAGMEAMIAYNCGCSIEYYTSYYGPECAGAIEDFYACISQASCDQLASGQACAQADMVVIETCGFGGGTGG